MVEYIIPLLYLLVFNGLFVLVFKQKFEKCLPASIITAVLLLYFGGLVGHISYGFYLFQLLCTVAIILFVYRVYKDKDFFKDFIENFATIGFVWFIVIYVFVMLLDRYATFTYWDEFQHWGPMAYQMFNLNKFYCVPEVTLVSIPKQYPPFSTIMEVLWCKMSAIYFSESFCYRGFTILNISMFFPLLSKLSIKKTMGWIKGLLIIVLILLIQVLCFTYYFPSIIDSIHVDCIMACLCLYGLYCVFEYKENELFKYVSIMLACVALILVKQIALFFYGLIILALLLKLIIYHKKVTKNQLLKYFFAVVIVPALFYASWIIVVAMNNVSKVGALGAGISVIEKISNGAGSDPLKQLVFNNFFVALHSETLLLLPFKTNYISGVILVTVFLSCLVFLGSKNDRKNDILIVISYFAGSVIYALAMLISYMYLFRATEAPELAGYVRYMGLYIYFGYCIIIWMMIRCSEQDSVKKNISIILLTTLLIIFSVGSNISQLFPKTTPSTFLEDKDVVNLQETIGKYVESGSNVLIVTQNSNNKTTIIRYLFQDINFNSISLGKQKYENDGFSQDLTSQEWLDMLKNYDYVYIDNFDDNFLNHYWQNLTECRLYNGYIYRITFEGNSFEPCRILAEDICE